MTRPGDNQRHIYRIEAQPDPELEAMLARHRRMLRPFHRMLAVISCSGLIGGIILLGLVGHACLPALLAWLRA